MATVIKKSASRIRTVVKTFTNASLGTLESDYSTYEATKAAVTTETWSVHLVQAYFDPVALMHVFVAVASYIERYDDNITPLP
jgi:hypothetical protein